MFVFEFVFVFGFVYLLVFVTVVLAAQSGQMGLSPKDHLYWRTWQGLSAKRGLLALCNTNVEIQM